MSDFCFFESTERKNYNTLRRAAKAGNKWAQKRLQKELNLKVADKKTLKKLNQDHRQGALVAMRPWL